MSFCFIVHSCFLFYFYLQHDIICACASAFYYAIAIFLPKKKKFSRPLYKKKFSSLPQPPLPPLAMLAAKRQDGGLFKSPPYPGYPFIMIPDLTSPYLPNGSLSPTARTVSSFIYSLYVHTHSSHTHTHTHWLPGLGAEAKADAECCHPEVQPIKMQSQVLQTPREVYSTMACMRACVPARGSQPVCPGQKLAC